LRSAKEQYIKGKEYYDKLAKKQKETVNFYSALRLITVIAGLGFAIFFYTDNDYDLMAVVLIAATMMFTILAHYHSKVIQKRKYAAILCEINEKALKRVENQWKDFADKGEEFKDENHNYTGDLDIFGKASLFQWINCAYTYIGRDKLRKTLEEPKFTVEEIYKRQEAIKELASNLGWKHRFMAEGIMVSSKAKNPEDLFKWGNEKEDFYCSYWLRMLIQIPVITAIAVIILFFATSLISYKVVLGALAVEGFLLIPGGKKRMEILGTVYDYKENIKAYDKMLQLIEKKQFHCEVLNDLKGKLYTSENHSASKQIGKLSNLASYISDRSNLAHFVFNLLFLLDYQYMFALEKWKKSYGHYLNQWIEAIGEMEALSSLSVISYEHPEWVMPKVVEEGQVFKAKHMGHPLLSENRVCNDLSIAKDKNILLITGSNMSGKSTMLRTSGINLVLAYTGAPVCAVSFSCSIMNIFTCMRVSDNLEKNISSFYAEILRIKGLVQEVNSGPVFFLLDEIFKGTNSRDRHMGAKLLINQFCDKEDLGLVSTHDLELGDLEKTNKKIRNYHFREFYNDNKIYFDYKLRTGVSDTQNAMYLMKMAGIEMDLD